MKKFVQKLFCCMLTGAMIGGHLFTPVFAATTMLPTESSSEYAYIQYGDIDQNGSVSVRDALTALQYAANCHEGTLTETQLDLADVNADGVITSEDALLILQCAAHTLIGGLRIKDFKANGTMWIAGDSIAEGGAKYGASYIGWGQVIHQYLTDDAVVHNTAISGRTAMYFTREDNYKQIMSEMQPGDILFIAFGHNDIKGPASATESSETEGSYKWYLKNYYIEPALRRGALPILMTSVTRCYNVESGKEAQYHWAYIQAARELAAEYHAQGIELPFINMFEVTWAEYSRIGTGAARRKYHASDDIHYNRTGAEWCAQLILNEVEKLGLDFAKYRK